MISSTRMARQLILLFALLIFPVQSNGISYHGVEEGGIPPLADLNVDWMVGVSKFYMLMGSKYTIYRFGDSFIGKGMEDIDETELKNTLCLVTRLTKKGTVTMYGFGQVLEYFMQVTAQKQTNKFTLHDAVSRGATQDTAGISYTTLTDNKSYFVAIIYWDVGQRSWIVLSKDSEISEKTEKEILKHVKEVGFDTNNAFKLSYKSCPQ